MKRLASFLLILLTLVSCTEEITRNNPTLEGRKDDVFWRANDAKATLGTNGSMTITGLTQFETLTLLTHNTVETTYTLGTSNVKTATYVFSKDGDEITYATGFNIGDGEIVIEEYDTDAKTISGTFRFNAVKVDDDNPDAPEILNYQYGRFYKVPVVPAL